MRRNAGSKIIILLLSFCLVSTMMPTAVFALPDAGTGTDAVTDAGTDSGEETSEGIDPSDAQNSDSGNTDGSGNDSASDQDSSTDNNSDPQSDQGTDQSEDEAGIADGNSDSEDESDPDALTEEQKDNESEPADAAADSNADKPKLLAIHSSDTITYLEKSWDGSSVKTESRDLEPGTFSVLSSDFAPAITDYFDIGNRDRHWYVVDGNFSLSDKTTLRVSGDTHLILTDGSRLTTKDGIYIKDGATLTIHAQSEGDSMGQLYSEPGHGPGIGGMSNTVGGNLVVMGGYVKATGGTNAAGIGGGNHDSGIRSVTIYGGEVHANGGSSGAGIGEGQQNNVSEVTTIYGGKVYAKGGKYSAGIGGGENRGGGTIKIYGGYVEAKGGHDGAGIGGGEGRHQRQPIEIHGGEVHATGGDYGAGIGGGENGYAYSIHIYGGNITAKGGKCAAGIGGGKHEGGGEIIIDSGIITATGGDAAAGIGGGGWVTGAAMGGGDSGDITINGGTVNAKAGYSKSGSGAAIGGGSSGHVTSITINDGNITADASNYHGDKSKGAGIGGGGGASQRGSITINGGQVVASAYLGAGIGGGDEYDGGKVTITDGRVVATSVCGAGIGGGGNELKGDKETTGNGGDVTISGGEVLAASQKGGAGIGGGYDINQEKKGGSGGKLTVTGGYVVATSGSATYNWANHVAVGEHPAAKLAGLLMRWLLKDEKKAVSGAGIGGAVNGKGADVTVTGGIVHAYADKNGRAIGHGTPYNEIAGTDDRPLNISDNMIVKAGKDYASRKQVAQDQRVSACRKNMFAEIRPGTGDEFKLNVKKVWPEGDTEHPESAEIKYTVTEIGYEGEGEGEKPEEKSISVSEQAETGFTIDATDEVKFTETDLERYAAESWALEVDGSKIELPVDKDTGKVKLSLRSHYASGLSKEDYDKVMAAVRSDKELTLVVTNAKKKFITVEKKWLDKEGKELNGTRPDSIKVVLQHADYELNGLSFRLNWKYVKFDESGKPVDTSEPSDPVELNAGNNWKYEFNVPYSAKYRSMYRVRELDKDGKVVNPGEHVTYSVGSGADKTDVTYSVKYGDADENGKYVIKNTADVTELKIEKKWDIDFENNDRPDSIEALVQQKKDGKWENVKIVKVESSNDWKAGIPISDGEYRVRELREETALQELVKTVKETMTSYTTSQYDEWLAALKDSCGSYYDMLPEDIKESAEQGSDSLKEKLNATEKDLVDKLLEKIGLSAASGRIVYDSADEEYKKLSDEDKKKKSNEANAVTLHVPERTSVAGEKTDAHVTKYKVSYKKTDDKHEYTISNKAILEIDVVKRWVGIGTDDDDMPKAAWVVLMFKPDADALENAKKAGIDTSTVTDFEFPVFRLAGSTPFMLDGGMDPVTMLGKLAIGVDLSVINKIVKIFYKDGLPVIAVARVTKDDNWRHTFTISKYAMKVPVEFKGAELGSEIIRQVIKYFFHISLPISYNPFNNFVSIPTKAIKTIEGINDPGDLLDLSKLSGAAKAKAESLTMDDIRNFGWSSVLTDYHLMANVINIKADWDTDSDDDKVTVEGEKTWKGDSENNRPDSITIRLKANGEEKDTKTVTSSDDWKWKFEDLDKKDSSGNEIEYTITEDAVDNYNSSVDGYNVTNTYSEGKTQVSVYKKWDDGNNADGIRPESVTVKLLIVNENDKTTDTGKTITLSESNNWTGAFKDLDISKDGKDIEYTVEEEKTDVITGSDTESTYAISEPSGDAKKGFTITNTHTPENVNISGVKTWDDNDDSDRIRPETIKVYLLANDKRVKDEDGNDVYAETSEAGGWKYSFPAYPSKDENGNKIEYSVTEDEIEGYEMKVDGYNITNTHKPETVTVEGKKTWTGDSEENRPESITIRLKADGEDAEDQKGESIYKTVTKDDDWSWKFEDLPKKKDGKEIKYSITEDAVENYTSEIEGYNVTNSYNEGKTQIKVEKKWKDSDNNDGIRPESVDVRLLIVNDTGDEDSAAATDTGKTITLNEENGWAGSFTDIDARDEEGNLITYTVEEEKTDVITGEDGPGTYATKVEGDASKGFVITNTHTPETINIEGTKVWEDNNDAEGRRPDHVTLRLKANGEDVKTVTVYHNHSEAGDSASEWPWKFAEVPAYEDGEPITYTITEDAVNHYSCEISGDAESGFTVTNTYKEGKTHVNVSKVWDDGDNQDGIRPESVKVRLMENEIGTDKYLSLSDDNNWADTFEDLDMYDEDGNEIEYSVEESTDDDVVTGTDDPTSYAINISGDQKRGFTVTNIHTPRTMDISVTKIWDDANDQDGIRPASVEVELREYIKIGIIDIPVPYSRDTIVLNKRGNWSGTFRADKDGNYGVREIKTKVVTGTDSATTYSSEVGGDADNGFIITNKHTPQSVSKTFRKKWSDEGTAAGTRPESLNVSLYKWTSHMTDESGEISPELVDSFTVDEGSGWTVTRDDLPKYLKGELINYYWEEEDLTEQNYGLTNVSIDEDPDNDGNEITTFTNTHDPDKIDLTCDVEWDDYDNNDGKRPDSLTMVLYKVGPDGKETEVARRTVNESNKWSAESSAQMLYDKDGNKIDYVWRPEPDKVDGYSYLALENGTNTHFIYWHDPEFIAIEVCKVWDDEDNQDGERPGSLVVSLYEDKGLLSGKELIDMITLTPDDEKTVSGIDGKVWYGIMDFLPKYSKGKEVKYYAEEAAVDDYSSESSGLEAVEDDLYRITFTNTHVPARTDISVKKVWDDNNNSDGIRPDSVNVRLLADSKDTGKTVTLSDSNNWKSDFENLYVRHHGEDIIYTVEEIETDVVTGEDTDTTYYVDVSGDAEEGFTVTNTHTPVTVDISGSKTWDDDGDAAEKRPESITVNLLADGKKVDSREVTREDSWAWNFIGVPVNSEDGKEISYTITEDAVDGYKTEIDGFNVINHYQSEPGPGPDPDAKKYNITYKLNGGEYNGSTEDIVETYAEGTVISIHAAPVREGYEFVCWKGSEYQPGDRYTVTEDHTFTAQWKKNPAPDPGKPGTPDKPHKGVRTGDETLIGLYFVLLVTAALLFAVMAMIRKRRKK